ncbi:hypothetical protein WISP_109321 [Willisornis vidua]|uniref:Uncharacterized protein n=1 Tax=Willisornis vidua TaxID=1566151 RepID=A0ABQ9CVY4_9PASS|nr:hypothetical protein WISP_109321 [Willisornis vidua]
MTSLSSSNASRGSEDRPEKSKMLQKFRKQDIEEGVECSCTSEKAKDGTTEMGLEPSAFAGLSPDPTEQVRTFNSTGFINLEEDIKHKDK